jgi:hypothetical protein
LKRSRALRDQPMNWILLKGISISNNHDASVWIVVFFKWLI